MRGVMGKKRYFAFSWLAGSILGWGAIAIPPTAAQISQLPNIQLPLPQWENSRSETPIAASCIRLDGRCLFQIAAPQEELSNRVQDIQQRLLTISRQYLEKGPSPLKVEIRSQNNQPVLYINNQELMTVTQLDADLQGTDLQNRAERLRLSLQQAFIRAYQERQPRYIARQGTIAGGIVVGMVVVSLVTREWHHRNQRRLTAMEADRQSQSIDPVTTHLSQKQQGNLQEVQHRLFQLAQAGIWGGGSFIMLGLFPHSRIIQAAIIDFLQLPITVGMIGATTYVLIRFSYVLIDRFASALADGYLLTPEVSQRLQLRVSTISGVIKSISTLAGTAIGIFVALGAMGVNTAPILAGAGLLGVALSLAAQNIIKDAINGFLIILEDQYAVGDVIDVGNVDGLVENINLRITQLRDAAGRLITIPNSEIKIVANLSSSWSRSDLYIPIPYHADVDQALQLIHQVAQQMQQDTPWQDYILEEPRVLGVEKFGDQSLIIRVWIKTVPLKQWDVSREFRRRVKVTLDQADFPLPIRHQEVWLHSSPFTAGDTVLEDDRDRNSRPKSAKEEERK